MKIWRKAVLLYLGGMGYVGLELLWRQRSHSSMFVLGGVCFLALGELSQRFPKLSPAVKATAGAGIVTILELITGVLVNRRHTIWDYSGLPANFMGQICLPFTLLWVPVSALAMVIHRRLSKVISYSTVF